MKGKKVSDIREKEMRESRPKYYDGLMKRIENRQSTVTAPVGIDLHMYGYLSAGRKGKKVWRWYEREYNRIRQSYWRHKKHPGGTFYHKE